ncbi:hypothetical protein [Roseimicrobium sp. ORNL1]|uniref:hypothetical protein n=1 Tax=Roseimicrobium sp. ORNL1 TaxID=2711231 RepID=UPI0013E20153|nr:hypothetical protein [Roseimicrobium sp. ORNL1]QIE99966.1 hypothetical protein G5S37_26185 [Roseimicrobium sp. ORNL1]
MRFRSLTFTLIASLAVALASCSKEEVPPVTKATAKPESTPVPAAPATTPESVAAVEPAKEEPPKPAPPKVELEAVTPATTATDVAVEAEKAKLQAEQAKLKEQQAKATASNDEVQKAEAANRLKQVEQKINALPRSDLGEGFEARASTADDGTRAALDKLLDNAPKNAPAPGASPPSPPAAAPAPAPSPSPAPAPANQ